MLTGKSVEGPKGGTTERNGETAKVHTLQGGEKSIVEARERTRSPALALSPKIKLIYACLLGPGGTICRESMKGSVWGSSGRSGRRLVKGGSRLGAGVGQGTVEGRFSSGRCAGRPRRLVFEPGAGGRAVS